MALKAPGMVLNKCPSTPIYRLSTSSICGGKALPNVWPEFAFQKFQGLNGNFTPLGSFWILLANQLVDPLLLDRNLLPLQISGSFWAVPACSGRYWPVLGATGPFWWLLEFS